MQLIIDNKARLSGASAKLHRELMDRFAIENPAYWAAEKAGRYPPPKKKKNKKSD